MLRTNLTLLFISCALFVSTGCIGGPGPEDFSGTWEGTETYTETIDGESETTVTPNTTLTLSEGSSADIILDLSNANMSCILRGNIEDDILVFETTTCTQSEGDGVTVTFNFSGEAELVDDEIQLELEGSLTATGPGGSVSGTVLVDFEGERL